MNIHKTKTERLNINPELQPLFDALKSGGAISEIIFIDRVANKRGVNSVKNFKATDYHVNAMSNPSTRETFDYVEGFSDNDVEGFYMSWVDSFFI